MLDYFNSIAQIPTWQYFLMMFASGLAIGDFLGKIIYMRDK